MIENFEVILSLVGTVLSLLVACITFLVKLVRSLKAKTAAERKQVLFSVIMQLVETAEGLPDISGSEKKTYVLTQANRVSNELGIEFDAAEVAEQVEELIKLTKHVNLK